jgi:rod shape-determining protein MreC
MGTLIRFLFKNVFTLMFIILEVFAFNLILSNNEIKNQRFANSTNTFFVYFQSKADFITDYFYLKEQNKALFEQLSFQKNTSLTIYKTNNYRFLHNADTNKILMYEYIPTEVIKNATHLKRNHFTLNAGSKQNVEVGMGVISPDGLAGVIREVSPNFSVAVSLLNIDLGVSAKLKYYDYFGTVKWAGESDTALLLEFIPNRINVAVGDTIITSGYSFIFPQNVPIGTISKVEKDVSTSFYRLQVKPSVEFQKLNEVWIIKNLLRKELDELNQHLN